jgi:sugar phosphate isomerase/epimerase
MEPRGRRRPGAGVRAQPVRRQEGLELIGSQLSLPTLNWLRFPELTPVWPLEDVLAGAAAAGFDAVGLDDMTLAGRDAGDAAALLDAYGLACTDVGVLRTREQAESLAALATATGARVCIAATDSIDDLRTGAAILAEAGVRTALEFVPYGRVRTLSEGIDACAAVGWDRCGLLIDSWHFFRGGEEWDILRSLAAEQIALVHVNDAPPQVGDLVHESRFRRLPPGEGTFPLAGFLDAFEEIGYDGVVSLEVLSASLRSRPPTEGARELHDAMRSIRPVMYKGADGTSE